MTVSSSPVSLEESLKNLGATREGLSQAEAKNRLLRDGYNELPEKKVSTFELLLSYFWGPMPWMIEAAIILCALVGDWVDFGIIGALLIGNALIGFFEEKSAGDAVSALKAQLALNANAKRDGQWMTVPARELVAGDIIRIKIGDVLPADLILLECDSLSIDQAALTGESLPVNRSTGEEAYSGSILKRGQAEAVVQGTGVNTFFGKTAKLVSEAETTDHLQEAVLKLSDYLIIINMLLVAAILVVRVHGGDNFIRVLKYCLVLTVASIPLATPTVLAVTMAIGSQLLAKKNALVTRLAAIDELAGVDMLCSDKTGTLTLNKLSLGDPYLLEGVSNEDLLLAAALASSKEDNDPIDLTIINGLETPDRLKTYTINHFTPFDPVSKRTEAEMTDGNGQTFKTSKGAPQVILDLDPNRGTLGDRVNEQIQALAKRGYRALGVARTDATGVWHFLGIISLFDPPRPDSQITIQNAKRLGVPLKMITGDQVAIAKETCHQLGLGQNVLNAEMFRQTPATQLTQLGQQIEVADGFAQVFPEDKFHIVETLQKRGYIVAMTGDGVNDAPALKQASAGIAVSGATDAARAAADIVLLTPGLSVIIDAIELSRQIFLRMNSYCIYRVVETIRILIFITLAIFVYSSYPVTVIMLVLLALINDGSMVTIAYDNTTIPKTPQRWNMPYILSVATVIGLVGVIETFLLYYYTEKYLGLSHDMVQTLVYLHLAVGGMMTIYVTRVQGPFWSIPPAPKMLAATGLSVAISTIMACFGILMTPIGIMWTLASWGYAFVWFLIFDWVKLWLYRLLDPNKVVILGSRYLKRWQQLKR
ncbi:MAG: plasma-membrane proton-efflux P-type ATPase [Merismopediaceae bacterium]|nr:plasma-membrane proton-efflux P-type ATPase [Merismopediaceae bacterium]